MSRVLRSMLMWLLAAALPLQGVSAATMTACGVAPHRHASAAPHWHAEVAGVVATGLIHMHDRSREPVDGGMHPAHSAKTAPAGNVAHKCIACAACCLNAGAPTEALSFEAAELTDRFAALVTRTLAAYVTEGLERPPRSLLA